MSDEKDPSRAELLMMFGALRSSVDHQTRVIDRFAGEQQHMGGVLKTVTARLEDLGMRLEAVEQRAIARPPQPSFTNETRESIRAVACETEKQTPMLEQIKRSTEAIAPKVQTAANNQMATAVASAIAAVFSVLGMLLNHCH